MTEPEAHRGVLGANRGFLGILIGLGLLVLAFFYALGAPESTLGSEDRGATLYSGGSDKADNDASPEPRQEEAHASGQPAQRARVRGDGETKLSVRTIKIYAYRADITDNVGGAQVTFIPLSYDAGEDLLQRDRNFLLKQDAHAKTVSVRTDERGIALVTLSPERLYLVKASHRGLISLGFPKTLQADLNDLRVPFCERLKIEGQVLDPNGRPLPGAGVSICYPRIRPGHGTNVVSAATTTSDSQGRFAIEIDNDVEGDAYIAVHHRDYVPLVEALPAGRSYSRLVMKLTKGISFQFRVMDAQGNPFNRGWFDLVQGRYTSILNTRPGGVLPDGADSGLKTIVNLRVSKFGIARVRGWPAGVPAWFTFGGTGIVGAKIVPDFQFRVADPWNRPLAGNYEFMPRDGQQYDIVVMPAGALRILVEGRAPLFSEADKRVARCFIQFSEDYSIGIKMVWQGRDFQAVRGFDAGFVSKIHKEHPTFKVRFSLPGQSDQLIGPFRFGKDMKIQRVLLRKL